MHFEVVDWLFLMPQKKNAAALFCVRAKWMGLYQILNDRRHNRQSHPVVRAYNTALHYYAYVLHGLIIYKYN